MYELYGRDAVGPTYREWDEGGATVDGIPVVDEISVHEKTHGKDVLETIRDFTRFLKGFVACNFRNIRPENDGTIERIATETCTEYNFMKSDLKLSDSVLKEIMQIYFRAMWDLFGKIHDCYIRTPTKNTKKDLETEISSKFTCSDMSYLIYRMYREALEIMEKLKSDRHLDGKISDTEFDRGVRSILKHRYAMIRSKMDVTMRRRVTEEKYNRFTQRRETTSEDKFISLSSAEFEKGLLDKVIKNGDDEERIPRHFKFHAIMQGSLCLTTLKIDKGLIATQARRLVNDIMNYIRRNYGTTLKACINQAVTSTRATYADTFNYTKQVIQGAPGGDINIFETEFTTYAFGKKGSTWRLFHSLLLEKGKEMSLTTVELPSDPQDARIQPLLDTLTEKIESELYKITNIIEFIHNSGSEIIASKLQTEFDAVYDTLEVMGVSREVAFDELKAYFGDINYKFENIFGWVWRDLLKGHATQMKESPSQP